MADGRMREPLEDLPDSVVRAALQVAQGGDGATVYRDRDGLGRTGLLFLKPEVAGAGPALLGDAVRCLLAAARKHEVSIRSAHVVSGALALRHRFVQRNYAVIHRNASFKAGGGAISPADRDRPRVGAFHALTPTRTAADLLALWRRESRAIVKLGDDCYGLPTVLDGREVMLVNGFYPAQIERYAEAGAKLALFTFDAAYPLRALKAVFQGDADPEVAVPGSVRHSLRLLSARHGEADIWTSQNGLHMSATADEGIAELEVFESCFGALLR